MQSAYILKDKRFYFLFGYNNSFGEMINEYLIKDVSVISENGFYNDSSINRVFVENCLIKVEKQAFAYCENLEVFCCVSNQISSGNDWLTGLSIPTLTQDFVIETLAFEGCHNLHTVILPEIITQNTKAEKETEEEKKTLVIEKSAFKGCESLRTVVALADNISFTENPFEDCPSELTFVCKEGSGVARFARENGYRSINV